MSAPRQGGRPGQAADVPARAKVSRFIRNRYKRLRGGGRGQQGTRARGEVSRRQGDGYVEITGPQVTIVASEREPDRRTGIYLRGACDLPGLFATVPLFRDEARGTVCLYKAPGTVESGRADLLLQTLQDIPAAHTAETIERLRLHPNYFTPDLFQPTFGVPVLPRFGEFPKSIVVLSIGANVIRTLYRHKQHGFLVDPGGTWLNRNVDVALGDRETIAWFADNFEKAGRLTVDEFVDAFSSVVREVKSRTGAEIVATNVLSVEPADPTHNFQLRPQPEGLRRRQFNLALTEISRDLGVHVLDLDRTLKRDGVDPSLDFAHFEGHSFNAVAAAAYRVLRDLDAF